MSSDLHMKCNRKRPRNRRYCVAPCCSSYGSDPEISFHKFPLKNDILLRQWLKAMQRKNFRPTNASYLCSKHFNSSDFIPHWKARRRLKRCAVPSVFPGYPKVLSFQMHRRRDPLDRSKITYKAKVNKTIAYLRRCIHLDHSYAKHQTVMDDLIETKAKLRIYRRLLKNATTRISILRTKNVNLSNLLKPIRNKRLACEDTLLFLERMFSDTKLEIFKSELHNYKRTKKYGLRYTAGINKFALTLNYLSPKAYEYVRTIFTTSTNFTQAPNV